MNDRDNGYIELPDIGQFTRHDAGAVWPDLTDEEYDTLYQSLDDEGQLHPIAVAQPDAAKSEYIVIDGWHRLLAICEINGRGERLSEIRPWLVIKPNEPAIIAAIIIGAHAGRRHLGKLEVARLVVETQRAAGMEFDEAVKFGEGQKTAETPAGQIEPGSNTDLFSITRESVAKAANVSTETAKRAIQEVKREQGLLPDKPPPEPRKSRVEKLEDEIWALKGEVADRDDTIADLQERFAFMEDSGRRSGADMEKFTNLQAKNRIINARNNELMHEVNRLKGKLKHAVKIIGAYRDKYGEFSPE